MVEHVYNRHRTMHTKLTGGGTKSDVLMSSYLFGVLSDGMHILVIFLVVHEICRWSLVFT